MTFVVIGTLLLLISIIIIFKILTELQNACPVAQLVARADCRSRSASLINDHSPPSNDIRVVVSYK